MDGGWLALLALACRRHSVNAECLFLGWEGSRLNSNQVTPNYNLEWSECRSKLHRRHPYVGEFEGRRSAVLTQTHAEVPSARFGSLLNGGSGGSDPQTRVLSTLVKLAPHKFSSLPISCSLEDLKWVLSQRLHQRLALPPNPPKIPQLMVRGEKESHRGYSSSQS